MKQSKEVKELSDKPHYSASPRVIKGDHGDDTKPYYSKEPYVVISDNNVGQICDIPDGSITTEKFAPDAKTPFSDEADKAKSVDWDNIQNKPSEYKPEPHSHPITQVEGLQAELDGKISEVPDKSIDVSKLVDALVSQIDERKITFLSGGQDANELTDAGVYLNNGGYTLHNAPRGNYGWMLIVSRGSSNNHHRGAQVYFDHDGFDWRGVDGDTFTDWETCIVKHKVMDIEPIADTTSATAEDNANKINEILDALKG